MKRHFRYKYKCACGIKHAAIPNQPIEKELPGQGLLADVLVNKYQDAMPLYRQMQRYRRFGYEVSDSTLCDWVKACALLLEPIVNTMREDLLLAKKIHTDDTPAPVVKKGKQKTVVSGSILPIKVTRSPFAYMITRLRVVTVALKNTSMNTRVICRQMPTTATTACTRQAISSKLAVWHMVDVSSLMSLTSQKANLMWVISLR